MKRIKNIIIIIGLIAIFLGYSYYNYYKRAKAIRAVEEYCRKNELTQIFSVYEMQFNIFDKLIENKTQSYFIFVNSGSIEKKDNQNYWVQCSHWKDARKLETLTNYIVNRNNDNFEITILDLLGSPMDYDTLNINEINGKIFESIDNWIKDKYNKDE